MQSGVCRVVLARLLTLEELCWLFETVFQRQQLSAWALVLTGLKTDLQVKYLLSFKRSDFEAALGLTVVDELERLRVLDRLAQGLGRIYGSKKLRQFPWARDFLRDGTAVPTGTLVRIALRTTALRSRLSSTLPIELLARLKPQMIDVLFRLVSVRCLSSTIKELFPSAAKKATSLWAALKQTRQRTVLECCQFQKSLFAGIEFETGSGRKLKILKTDPDSAFARQTGKVRCSPPAWLVPQFKVDNIDTTVPDFWSIVPDLTKKPRTDSLLLTASPELEQEISDVLSGCGSGCVSPCVQYRALARIVLQYRGIS